MGSFPQKSRSIGVESRSLCRRPAQVDGARAANQRVYKGKGSGCQHKKGNHFDPMPPRRNRWKLPGILNRTQTALVCRCLPVGNRNFPGRVAAPCNVFQIPVLDPVTRMV